MTTPAEFDDIRPYNDEEVRPTLDRLLHDREFLDTVARLKAPWLSRVAPALLRPLVRRALAKETAGVEDVAEFQQRVKVYLRRVIDQTSTLSVSGLERLTASQGYCFISNHRDIAMDSAYVNWALFHHHFKTLRIAIGDNLLTKSFASDLMRLNKSFIVNRSATAPREKLKAAKKLSAYIQYSIVEEAANIWIAQREGRAKDGKDKTNPAIISMLMLGKKKGEPIAEYLNMVPIVPVTISYEFDPCDEQKARELTLLEQTGTYQKGEHEDVLSIARGISGFKGHVHLDFGEPLNNSYETVEDVVDALDKAVWNNYVLHPTNCLAYEMLEKKSVNLPVGAERVPFLDWDDSELRAKFKARVEACAPEWRDMLLKIYANPVYTKLGLGAM